MTREEKLEAYLDHQYMFEYGSPDYIYGIRKGVKWADENPKSPWISVEEKLPDDGVLVIVAYRWILGEILYASDTFHIDYGWEGYDDIVAWMPIPELPKEGDEL